MIGDKIIKRIRRFIAERRFLKAAAAAGTPSVSMLAVGSLREPGSCRTFEVDEAQWQKAAAWQEEHDQKHICPKRGTRYDGAIGGAYTWCFTLTSLGAIVNVQCSRCEESTDVTDYDQW